ncbi:MAG: transcription elongation factor GreA [Sedimentisphaerales bacterium]|nr:transcription elongation factor GreA [Sedimentisphaerales bacterium]
MLRKLEPMSRTGYNNLMKELTQLETVELPEVLKNVAEARELGDLKENGAYIYGRERQGHIVGRIGELKGKLNRAEIVDCTKVECDKARFGTVVTLLDLDTQKKIIYQLLGPDDADFDTGSISIYSPIGNAILGCSVGDKISVELPRGVRNLQVTDIARSLVD